MNKFLLIRILGNDIPGIHLDDQSIRNLIFTLKNEELFSEVDKLYVLNKIIDDKKKKCIINELERHNAKYLDIPATKGYLLLNKENKLNTLNSINKCIKKIDWNKSELILNCDESFFRIGLDRRAINFLYKSNIHLLSLNETRNYCIRQGKKNKYEWTCVFDSNNFLTAEYFNQIKLNIHEETEYLIIPQIRLDDIGLDNSMILNSQNELDKIKLFEPQIIFKNTSHLVFNNKFPYGNSNKAELLRVMQIPGEWNRWNDSKKIHNLTDRKKQIVKYQILSKVIRLQSMSAQEGHSIERYNNRVIGFIKLINKIYDEL